MAARQCECTRRDGAAVVERFRHRGGQYEPRTTIDDAGGPEAENDAASSVHCVVCLGAHWMADSDVPEPAQKSRTALNTK